MPARCGSLRRVIASGEALPYRLVERCYERLPGVVLENLYGPTEAAVDVTRWSCPPRDPRGIVPIGFPVANTRCYVLDARLEPVPVGTPGELYLGGVQLARGYFRRAALTAERFVPDPFGAGRAALQDGRPGPLAGRRDARVPRAARRAGENPRAADRAGRGGSGLGRLARRGGGGRGRAGAPRAAGAGRLSGAARGFRVGRGVVAGGLERRLSAAMIPAVFQTLAALPLSANGKVDRRRLPAVDRSAPAARAYTAPRNAREERLAAVFAHVLGVAQVGVEDNYFTLGGDSIRAIRLVAEAQAAGLAFSLAELFRAPTVAQLAALGAGAGRRAGRAADGTLEFTGGRGPRAAARGRGGRLSARGAASGHALPQRLESRDGRLPRRLRRAADGGTGRAAAALCAAAADAPARRLADALRAERFYAAAATGRSRTSPRRWRCTTSATSAATRRRRPWRRGSSGRRPGRSTLPSRPCSGWWSTGCRPGGSSWP